MVMRVEEITWIEENWNSLLVEGLSVAFGWDLCQVVVVGTWDVKVRCGIHNHYLAMDLDGHDI